MLGIAHTVVKPPWAAAASPLAIVSAASLPGSRRCACRSMKPGATMTPRSSMRRSPPSSHGDRLEDAAADDEVAGPSGPPRDPRARRGQIEVRRRVADLAAARRASRWRSCTAARRPAQREHGHPDRHAVRDLLGDQRPRARRRRLARSRRPRSSGPGASRGSPARASASRSEVSPKRAAYSWSDGSRPAAIRSFWIRSAMTASASRSAAATSVVTVNRRSPPTPAAAHASNPRSSVAGPQTQTSAPGRGQRPQVAARDARVEDVAEDHDLAARERAAAAGAGGACTGRAAPASGGRGARRRR